MKNLKNTIALVLITLVSSAFIFTSCDKTKEEQPTSVSTKTNIVDTNWVVKGFIPEKNDVQFNTTMTLYLSMASVVYDFKADGTYTGTITIASQSTPFNGTWSLNADETQMTIDGTVTDVKVATTSNLELQSASLLILSKFFGDNIDTMPYNTGKVTIKLEAKK
jgi:hypothetical protein